MIIEDNVRCGTLQSATYDGYGSNGMNESSRQNMEDFRPSARPTSMPAEKDFQPYRPDGTSREAMNGHQRSGSADSNQSGRSSDKRQKPPIHPKPSNLQPSKPRSSNTDSLAERFAQLRSTGLGFGSTRSAGGVVPSAFTGLPSSLQIRPNEDSNKVGGPRSMPPPLNLPKPTLNSSTSMPRAPSPAYNPARNMQSPGDIPIPRSTVRSLALNGRTNSISGPPSSIYSQESEDESETLRSLARTPKPDSADLPNTTAITPEELIERVRSLNILLIDVRSREDFDNGHIFAKSIICIEPLALKGNPSAEDLEERLVVSPEKEQILFERRNEYDLVVYYDQGTTSNSFLVGKPDRPSTRVLRSLYDTLCIFNYNKELRRPPAVLIGGLDAWTDLVGQGALQVSQTTALMGSARPRRTARVHGRPISRVPMANSSLEIRKRRLRELQPLDADERRTWLEKARNEEVDPTEYEQNRSDSDGDVESVYPDGPDSPLVTSYEDFLRRFPEPQSIQESMIAAPPRSEPPSRFAPLPSSSPSRPPPAVPRPAYQGVSDHASSLTSPISRTDGQRLPLYNSRSVVHYLKLPRTGLINFSVTCYMNATIQCLLASIPLSQFFLDNRWRDFVQKNWKGSNGIMPEIYANLIRSMWKNDVTAVRPSSLRNFCARLNQEWGVDRQQDAKEFFDFLVDCLHEDLNTNWQRNPLRPLTVEEELTRERMPIARVSQMEWDRYLHRESSFISSLFAGQHASTLRCATCNKTSTTYEAFYSISVEIPHSGLADIQSCLQSYCQEERLSGDEVWKCPYCKCEREATKRITLTRLPQLLVIHFKRFSASKTESARKVHTPIDFPLFGLDMLPYMAQTSMPNNNNHDVMINGPPLPAPAPSKFDTNATTPPFLYDAYAVMRHLGQTGNGGHYISLIKDASRHCWRKFDDDRATDFEPSKLRPQERLTNEQAYIVFYGRSVAR